MSPFLEAFHDAAVGCYAVAVMTGLKGFNQDDVAVAMKYKHDVEVARAGTYDEPAHAISVQFTDRFDDYVEFFDVLVGTLWESGESDHVGLDDGFFCLV